MRALAACLVFVCVLGTIHGTSALNCTFESSLGTLEFEAYACPGNASCVVSASANERSAKQMFIPVGCCPSELPVPCMTNTTTYTKLHGCCPENKVCCVANLPGVDYMMGCASDTRQCCSDRICPENYRCCSTKYGRTCCPQNTLCRENDFYVPSDMDELHTTLSLVSSFFNISNDQLCIPAHIPNNREERNLTFVDGVPTGYPLQIATYNGTAPSSGILFYVTNVTMTPNVIPCGKSMCYDTDVCVHRYRNISKPRVLRTQTVDCKTAKMMDPVAWTGGCFKVGYEISELSYAAGCCPSDTLPCGAHMHTFTPYAINTHASPFLYAPVFACAQLNETCCYPYLCPATAQCCTARRQVVGVDINVTALADLFGPTLLATANEGHNFCCPADAYCCEYIPRFAKQNRASRRPKSIPFCGTDETCTRDYYSGNRKLFDVEVVRETIPFTGSHFTDSLAQRDALGVTGNVEYYTTDPNALDDTCFYQIDLNGSPSDRTFFDISCSVLNAGNTTSPAGVEFAGNTAPFDQLAFEIGSGQAIVCPPNAPAPWCVMP